MADKHPLFENRGDAGRQLSEAVSAAKLANPVIVALSSGGISVAFEIAHRLAMPLDFLIVRNIEAPGHPEQSIGMVVDGLEPHTVVDEAAARRFRLPPGYLDTERHHQLAEIERRHRMYFGEDEPGDHDHKGRDVILVDDGTADTAFLRAGVEALRHMQVGSISLAVPVAAKDLVERLRREVDKVICLSTPNSLADVSAEYAAFDSTPDQEVARLLREAKKLGRMLH